MRQSSIRNTLASLAIVALGMGIASQAAAEKLSSAFAIAEKGDGKWQLCWHASDGAHRFSGTVFSSEDSQLSAGSRFRGVAVSQPGDNQVAFDAATGARESQCIDLAVTGDSQLIIDVAIDGVRDTNPYLVFATDQAHDFLASALSFQSAP